MLMYDKRMTTQTSSKTPAVACKTQEPKTPPRHHRRVAKNMKRYLGRFCKFLKFLCTRSARSPWQDLCRSFCAGSFARNLERRAEEILCSFPWSKSFQHVSVSGLCTRFLHEVSWQDLCTRSLQQIFRQDPCKISLYEIPPQGLCEKSLGTIALGYD